jgi:PKD repeat protein
MKIKDNPKSILAILLTAILAVSALASVTVKAEGIEAPWSMFMHDPQRSGKSSYSGPQSDIVKWVFAGIPAFAGRDVSQPIIGSDGTIYVYAIAGSYLYAIDSDGNLKWRVDTGYGWDSSFTPPPAVGPDGTIYAPTMDAIGTKLLALDSNGSTKWSYSLGSLASAPAIGPDGVIYIGSGSVYAINPDGTLKWKSDVASTGDPFSMTIGPDGTIYVPESAGLAALNFDGSLKWRISTGWISGSPAIGPDSTIYLPIDMLDRILAISPTGDIKWMYDEWGVYVMSWSSPPLAIGPDGTIYSSGHSNRLYAISPDGELEWRIDLHGWAGTPVVDANGTIFVTSEDVNAINADGTLKWKYTNPYNIHGFLDPSIGLGRTLYVVHGIGELYAFGEVSPDEPPVANAGLDQTADEGSVITFDASNSTDPDGSIVLYEWDVNGDDIYDVSSALPIIEYTYEDDFTGTLNLRVTDDEGLTSIDEALVTVNNVEPAVSIDSIEQPNPHFILPHQVLTFTGSFTDPGWLDVHAATWDFGDGTSELGTVIEENIEPDATGTTITTHTYSEPGTCNVTLTVTDDDGGVSIVTTTVTVVRAEEGVGAIDDYIQNSADDAFKNNPGQRRNAFSEKLAEATELIDAADYQDAIDMLQHDIRAKVDGSVDGNPKNDWITDPEVQQEICAMIDDLIAFLETLL